MQDWTLDECVGSHPGSLEQSWSYAGAIHQIRDPFFIELNNFLIVALIPVRTNNHTSRKRLFFTIGNKLVCVMSGTLPASRVVSTTHECTSYHGFPSYEGL